jgi:hypothetical protein
VIDQQSNIIESGSYTQKASNELVNGDNSLFNAEDVREFHWAVNGKDKAERERLRIVAYECKYDCEPEPVGDVPLGDPVLWSEPASWSSGAVPVAGEEVEIEPGINMILDIDTPILDRLLINGRLTFQNDVNFPKDLTLNAKLIYVYAGELVIGTENVPYSGNAKIVLHGEFNDRTLQFSDYVEGGNKVLAVTGEARFFGQ